MCGGTVSKKPAGAIRKKKNDAKGVNEGKKNFLEDIVAFIYSRLDEAAIPPEKLMHPRVFELRNRVERGKTTAKSFRKRRAACNHRKRWISSPLAQDFTSYDEFEDMDLIESSGDLKDEQSDSSVIEPHK